MNFEKLLSNFDMGVCVDQQQREALVDLVILFVEIDGIVDQREMQYTQNWLESLIWTSTQSPADYLKEISVKCQTAIANNQVEDFIRHRASHIIDPKAQHEAVKLAEGVALADEELADVEEQALTFLKSCFY
ncbi:MAG: TerB family tellurite resistance protein [Gammaproteobacteria bacterium]|nr:TerB family tellurite resistance protein [Gammaproteobacteria bacterium]